MAEEKSRTGKNVVLRYNTLLVNLPLDVSRDVIPTDSLSRNYRNEWLLLGGKESITNKRNRNSTPLPYISISILTRSCYLYIRLSFVKDNWKWLSYL